MSKKFLRIIAGTFITLLLLGYCDPVFGMKELDEWVPIPPLFKDRHGIGEKPIVEHMDWFKHATSREVFGEAKSEKGNWSQNGPSYPTQELYWVGNCEKRYSPGWWYNLAANCPECYDELPRETYPILYVRSGKRQTCGILLKFKSSTYKRTSHNLKCETIETRTPSISTTTTLTVPKISLVTDCPACELAYADLTELLKESYSRHKHKQLNTEYLQLHNLQEEKRIVDSNFKSTKEEINLFKKEFQKKNSEYTDLIVPLQKECKELSIAKKNQENKFNEDLQKITIHIDDIKKENNEFKQTSNLLLQKFEESQKKHEESEKEFKLAITSLSEENKSLKKLFTTLPSTHECELFNMGEEQFLSEGSTVEKIRMLYRGAYSLHTTLKNLKQKATEFGLVELEDKNIISVPTQIILEDQAPEYCVSILLKKDPSIFLPWRSIKEVHKLMYDDVFLSEDTLPFNILVKDKENEIPLLSYVKEKREMDLDADVSIEGKNNFKETVFNIEKIQGNFWKDNEIISTVPILLKKLNEGDGDKEWVPGWSTLEEDYKKYVLATVLYKMSKRSFPKKYEDIESYLMDK